MNAIVLVVDRLHLGYLGCYGNAWIGTPWLDRLAVEGFVFDQACATSPRLEDALDSFWTGRHPLAPATTGPQWSLPAALEAHGVTCALVSDDPLVADHPLAGDFSERQLVECPAVAFPAAELEDTQLARTSAAAIDWLERLPPSFLLWIHTQGLTHALDAPLELRRGFVDEGEEPPPEGVDLPHGRLAADADPDLLLGIRRAYAGQVKLLDQCLGALLMALGETRLIESTLLVLLSPRGMPLGEHRRVGPLDDGLYSELIHLPWLMRFPDGRGEAARSQALIEPADLFATLGAWWGAFAPGERRATASGGKSLLELIDGDCPRLRDRVLIQSAAARGLRVASWYQIQWQPAAGGQAQPPLDDPATAAGTPVVELYAKPDDRWEFNEVADRCGEAVAHLRAAMAATAEAIAADQTEPLPPLDPVLEQEHG